MITLNFIRHFVEMHAIIAYIVIVLGVIIEGEIVVIIAGIFANLGSLHFGIALVSTLVGGSIKSIIGYYVGAYLKRAHAHRSIVRKTESRINYFLPNFEKKPFWSIFISRFLILGLHWFSLIHAGYKKINIRRFVEAEAASLAVWSVAMLSLGFFFSFTALSISRDIRKFLGIILVCFILFFIVERIVAFIIEFFELDHSSDESKL